MTGARTSEDLEDFELKIRNRTYRNALRVTKEELLYDRVSQVQRRIDDLARTYNEHWEDLLVELLRNGAAAASKAYDGAPFFSSTHPGASGNQSNLTTRDVVTPTDPTKEEFHDAIFEGIETLHTLENDQGDPYRQSSDEYVVIVPPSLFKAAVGALNAQLLAQGESNVLMVSGVNFRLHQEQQLKAWTDRFVIATRTGRSLIRQQVDGPRILSKTDQSDFHIDTGMHEHTVEATRAAGYGSWQEATLVTLT